MTTSPPFYSFPVQATWIPDTAQIATSGQVLLGVAGQALDSFPVAAETRGTPYQRRVLTTGNIVPLVPEQDGQLVVSAVKLAIGRAGEERFQFDKGDLGTYAQRFSTYQVQLARTSPLPTGGIAPRMQRADDLADHAVDLWTDAYVVWSALLALSLGGVKDGTTGNQVTPAPLTQDNVLIGPMTFDPPEGGLAVAKCEVQIQL